jgi:hypothetical protein
MAKDFIGYQALTDAALRGVVRDALRKVEKQGLVASHHFRITFKTGFPGVEIPDFLKEQYPEEMMIILQHQFWGLKDNHFEVTLSFKKIPATLVIPFAALTQFADPGVSFGLQFREAGEDGELKPVGPAVEPTPLTPHPKTEHLPAASAESSEEKPAAAPGEVVSLDAFRKK